MRFESRRTQNEKKEKNTVCNSKNVFFFTAYFRLVLGLCIFQTQFVELERR
jgi:hypothetical protein